MSADHEGLTTDTVWAEVTARYGGQCGCSGQCGASHRTTRGRCPRLHYGDGSANQRLLVVPIDPHAADPAGRSPMLLMAICRACHDGWRRELDRADRAAAAEADQLNLFGDPPCTTPPCPDPDETAAPARPPALPAAAVSVRAVIRLTDELTAAHAAGIHLPIPPNAYVMWDPARHRYVATAGLTVPPDSPHTDA
ncbi:hypothetical protein [Yinghuangia sp. YIM S09857]|uniref:hypothetical protein n=1 Tax=Yinghuangia sp. YIM S09857 TaxID=3436929 RepID=UPI003F533164